ncbi:Methyl-CpG-binding domain protein 4 [Turnera subulata]|uniref:Methyl-CpG-binding domain protein 4 n=1 Tax=Turnera subulata TaxID=218843 RepID=A0A9Q0JCV6_9ROSI|nr:Methyl-CpG-binding domain protein 4 [Turnera subulata]
MAPAQEDTLKTPKTTSRNPQAAGRCIDIYSAQCDKCLKWRIIDAETEFEDIRSKMLEEPFVCERKVGVSCDDPADIEYDSSRIWVLDKLGIPKTPEGFRRSLVLRKDFSKMDAYYITPTGKKLRTRNEIAAFLETDPKYKDISPADFVFTSPKIMEDTIPEDAVRKSLFNCDISNKKTKVTDPARRSLGTGNRSKKMKVTKDVV